jgi:BolA protein
MNTYQNRIVQKLTTSLSPTYLLVRDDSHHHAGHSGANDGGETHFHVAISAVVFKGLSRVEQHRLIYNILSDELKDRVHALSLEVI